MKNFMVKIDKQYRFTIPLDVRQKLNISNKQKCYFYYENNSLFLSLDDNLNSKCVSFDYKFRIILPSIYRRFLEVKPNSLLSLSLISNNRLIVEPANSKCIFCGKNTHNLFVSFRDKSICPSCIKELKNL